MNILVVGGAGYIGSHMVKQLGGLGVSVTTLDNLSGGHRDAVLCGRFVQGDLADGALLAALLAEGRFDAVMHFASFIQVGESVQDPAKYYQNNVVNTLALLDAMRRAGVRASSSRRRRRAGAATSRCSGRTTTRRTAPASATTCTSTICARRTGWRCRA